RNCGAHTGGGRPGDSELESTSGHAEVENASWRRQALQEDGHRKVHPRVRLQAAHPHQQVDQAQACAARQSRGVRSGHAAAEEDVAVRLTKCEMRSAKCKMKSA